MFVILPFEKDFYKKFDWDVDYVGNPVLDAIKQHRPTVDFKSVNGLSENSPLVALLPGSRKQELQNVVPLLASVAKRFPQYQFAVATVDNLNTSLYEPLKALANVKFVVNDTYNLLLNAKAAVVTSGTATLETALLKTPQVVIYKTSTISYGIARYFIQVPYISLVNLIAGKTVVQELIQADMNVEKVSSELMKLVEDEPYRNQMQADYNSIYQTLDVGSASENAARLMVGYLSEKK
jgi:lipid-A-disaccharide synthase